MLGYEQEPSTLDVVSFLVKNKKCIFNKIEITCVIGDNKEYQVRQKTSLFQASCDRNLTALRDDLATDLFELEEEYYSSSYKWTHLMNEYWTCFNDPDQDRNIPEKLQQIAKIHKIQNLLLVDQNNLLNSLVFSEMRKGILGLD